MAISDPGTSKHQCVTMRTKDFFFRECLCLKKFLWIKAARGKKCGIKPTLRVRTNFKISKNIITGNTKYFKCGYSDPLFCFLLFKNKYLQKEYKRFCQSNAS